MNLYYNLPKTWNHQTLKTGKSMKSDDPRFYIWGKKCKLLPKRLVKTQVCENASKAYHVEREEKVNSFSMKTKLLTDN